MSTHTGVSCDACMKTNFPGRRYKCLLCDNYDLCGPCYDAEAESQNHKNDHAMQCILTDTAYDIFYSGESIPRRTVVSLTCSHCGVAGFIPRTLLAHCVEKHPTQVKNSQAVMCPICVTSPSYGSRSRFALLADHIATVHDDGSGGGGGGGDEDPIPSSSILQPRRGENEEDDSDEDEDEEEEPSLNDLEHRAFIEEEHRRQEAARQRLAHASSLAAVVRNDYAAALSGNTNSQRRPLSRQTAVRGTRGGLRGHFNNYPYGTAPRTTTGFGSGATLRAPPDAPAGGNSSQNAASNDPFASFLFAQDPMLEFVSRLVNNNQQSSTTPASNASNNQYLFASSNPLQAPPPTTSTADYVRLQLQTETNESMAQIKTTLLNAKQKRSSQQQQSSTSTQPVILTHPSGYDYQLWQQHFPNLQPTHNNLNFLTGVVSNDLTTGNSNMVNSLSKNSQQSYREHDPRSLLGKTLRNDNGVNNDESNANQQQDHMSFLQSILLSTMINNLNEEQNENELTINNKENHL